MENKLKTDNPKAGLSQWQESPPGTTRRLRLLAEAAADFFDKSVEELQSKVRTNELVWPRSICMWIARDDGYTLQAIGDWWRRDHHTVSNAVTLVNDLREQRPAYDKQFRQFMLFFKNYKRMT